VKVRDWVCERLEAGSWPIAMLILALLAVGVGIVIGIVMLLVSIGAWPFFRLADWLWMS
jgi:hypothetical protein